MAKSHAAETPRLYLELLDPENKQHLDGYANICTDPLYLAILSGEAYTREEAYARLQQRCNSPERPWIQNYAIMRKDGDATTPAVGLVGVIRHHVAKNEAGEEIEEFEMGYGLHSSFWNTGYGSEAVTAFLNLFWSLESRKDVPYLMCWISDSNEPSQKLCKKMGGKQRVGVVAKHEGHDLGIWIIDRPKS